MFPDKRHKYTAGLFVLAVVVVYFVCHLTAEFRVIYNDAIRLKNWAASVRSLEACAIAQKTSGSAMFIECSAADREADMWPVWRALELTIVHFAGDVTGMNALSSLPGMGPDGAIRASIVSAVGWVVHSAALVIPLVLVCVVYFGIVGRVPDSIRSYLRRAPKVKVDEPEIDMLPAKPRQWAPPPTGGEPPSGYWNNHVTVEGV